MKQQQQLLWKVGSVAAAGAGEAAAGGVWCPSVLLTDGNHTFLCISHCTQHTSGNDHLSILSIVNGVMNLL